MIIDLFGEEILNDTKEQVIRKINQLPPRLRERGAYMLKEFAELTNVVLTEKDFRDVNA